MKIQVEAVAYHRNGVSGEGFHVVCFRWAEDGDESRPMVAVLFGAERERPACRVAVLDREMTRAANVAFAAGNSWRGDHFADALWAAVDAHDKALDDRLMAGAS